MPTEPSPPARPSPSPGRATRRPTPTPLRQARRADRELRQVVLRARRWGLQRGRGCATDALTVVVGVALDGGRAGLVSPKRWTVERLDALYRGEAVAWCRRHEATVPVEGLAEALVLWVDYLEAHRLLGPGSDPTPVLRRAAQRRPRGARPAGRAASRRRHPAGRGSA